MKFRFTGKYTNGATGVSILGHRFEGREPTDVTGEAAERLARHPEYEAAYDEVGKAIETVGASIGSAPKRRGRKPKAAQ